MPGHRARWTILTYIAAHNDLHAHGRASLKQISQVGSTASVVHGALCDGYGGAARYIFGEPGRVLEQERYHEFDSGDPQRLIETAKWLFQKHPAEHYGLVLWSHGTGWEPWEKQAVEQIDRAAAPESLAIFRSSLSGMLQQADLAERAILFDDGSGHALDTIELQKVTVQLQQAIGQPIALLGLDACLMANLEVAYQVRDSVDCMVASEELVPGESWPYDRIYGQLKANPDMTPKQLSSLIVKCYTAYYRENPPGGGDITQVALSLRGASQLAGAIDGLAAAILSQASHGADLLWGAQWEAYMQESRAKQREPSKFRYHLWDLGSLAARLNSREPGPVIAPAAQATLDALRPGGPLVLEEAHCGSWFDGIGGVSIYMPREQRISPYYATLALAADTRWDEMLAQYHEAVAGR